MRPLTEEETKIFFDKLSKYIGRNIQYLVDRKDEPHVFRLHNDRVYYVSELVVKRAENIPRDCLISLGTCFGKFTKGRAFKLHITALDYLAQFGMYKMWIKPSAEMNFAYGNHVLKSHVARTSEGLPEHQGVIVYTSKDIPLGFAASAKSAAALSLLDNNSIAAFHQADVGEYLRDEANLL